MIRLLCVFLFFCLSYSNLVNANQCKIVNNTIEKSLEANLPLKNILQSGLEVYTPIPKETILSSDGIVFVYGKDNIIGLLTVQEKFQIKETIEKTIKEAYFYDCVEPIIKIDKPDFNIFIIENKSNLDDKLRMTVFFINKKDDSYFYLLSSIGLSKNEVIQMLIRE